MTYQKKLPLFKYYRKIETESGYILYSLYPFGNFTFDYSLDRKTYKFGLTGSLIFKDFTNDNGEYKDNFTQLKAIESDGKFTLLVKKYCSENYEDYWEGEVDLLGDWNNIDRVLTTNTIINDNTSLVENNKDVEYNIFSFGIDETIITDTKRGESYNYTYSFQEIFQSVLSRFSDLTFVSQFFTSTNNPVTGDSNYYKYLYLSQISDIKYPTASNPATIGNITLEMLINWLYLFGCNYYILGDDFIVEHEIFFKNDLSYSTARTVGIDLTTLESGKYIFNKNSYIYNKSLLFGKEKYNFEFATSLYFRDYYIDYSDYINSANENRIVFNNIFIDITAIKNNIEDVSNIGFVLLSKEILTDNLSFETFYSSYQFDDIADGWTYDIYALYSNSAGFEANTGDEFTFSVNIDIMPTGANASFVIVEEIDSNPEIVTEYKFSDLSIGLNNITHTVIYDHVLPYVGLPFLTIRFFPLGFSGGYVGDRGTWNFISLKKTKTIDVENIYLSPYYLLNKFGIYNKPFVSGKVRGELINFINQARVKEEEEIKNIPVCCDAFDSNKLVKSNVGDGEIVAAKIHQNGVMDLTLKH